MKKELIDIFEKLGFEPLVIDDNANITSVKEAIAYSKLRAMIDDAHDSINSIIVKNLLLLKNCIIFSPHIYMFQIHRQARDI